MVFYASAKRSNNDTVVLTVPVFTAIVDMEMGEYYNATTANINNPEFTGALSLFVASDTVKSRVIAAGMTNVIDMRTFAGDIWTFPNGSYIEIRRTVVSPDRTDYGFYMFDTGGNQVWNNVLTPDLAQYYAFTLPSFAQIGGYYQPALLYVDHAAEFRFANGLCPVNTYRITYDYWSNITYVDPLSPGGIANIGGGQGTFSGTGDAISTPSLPTLGAVSTGFITLFNPSITELNALASYMWSSSLFDLNTWQKLFADPMDAILGLSLVPVAVPNGGQTAVRVGNITTNVTMTKAASQFVEVDCGSLEVKEFWGAYLDYEPFTKAEIYLPYIGTHAISVDDIMGKTVNVKYHVDILSGACCAYVKCGDSILYQFIGQCSSSIPISGNDFTNVINGVLSAGVAVGSMVATGGATAPMAVPQLASAAVNNMKPAVEKSGAMSGTGGMLGVQTPYLILTRPRQALPDDQSTFTGYPSFITKELSSLEGYTEIEAMHLENISATESELTEIESLLKGGVIF